MLLALALAACRPSVSVVDTPSWEGAPTRPSGRRPTGGISLSRRPEDLVELDVPASSRPEGQPAPEWFTPHAPFQETKGKDDVRIFRTPLPIHSNLLATRLKSTHTFGSGAPPGFRVVGPSGTFSWDRTPRRDSSYGFTREHLYIGVDEDKEPPARTDIRLKLPRATRMEDELNYATSDLTIEAFALRNLTIDTTSTQGLFLPAPGRATWELDLPERAVLTWQSCVLPPAIRDALQTDGAVARVEVEVDGQTTEVGRVPVRADAWDEHRFDLSAWGGRKVRVRIVTEPGENALYDYVFFENPSIYTPTDDPRRVVLVFIDTLRRDNLPIYGYPRRTMPRVSRWARFGTVFEQARSVAPWTLPSARALLTGAEPELWYDTTNLPERLGREGYATEAIIANAFLSQPFDMERGWDRYTYEHIASAERVSQLGVEALRRYPDRDTLLMVHYMDPHLPYEEPWTHQRLWAGIRPPNISITRRWLMDLRRSNPDFEAIKAHVTDRYDQNLRYVDDYLFRVLDEAGPDATVVLFSDHGEEFWEHDSFEHGHSFYDELLRVPLVIRGPGVPAGRVSAPVSLLDVTPTVLELEGITSEVLHGASLVPVMYGDRGAADALEARPQAFGRPLYDQDGWGVITDGKKFVDRDGYRYVWDLRADPGETHNLGANGFDGLPEALADALDREVVLAWRLEIVPAYSIRDVELTVSHPDGIESAWAAYDPRGKSAQSQVIVDADGVLHVTQPRGEVMHSEVYVVPMGDPLDVDGLSATFLGDRVEIRGEAVPPDQGVRVIERSEPFLQAGGSMPRVAIDLAYVPRPTGVAVSGYSEEMAAELKELGYLDEE